MTTKNTTIDWMVKTDPLAASIYGTSRNIVFAKLFWSIQSADPTKRKSPARPDTDIPTSTASSTGSPSPATTTPASLPSRPPRRDRRHDGL